MVELQHALTATTDALRYQSSVSDAAFSELYERLVTTVNNLEHSANRFEGQLNQQQHAYTSGFEQVLGTFKDSLLDISQNHELSLQRQSSDLASSIQELLSELHQRTEALTTSLATLWKQSINGANAVEMTALALTAITDDAHTVQHALLSSKLFAREMQDQQLRYSTEHLQQLSQLSNVLNNLTDKAKLLQEGQNSSQGLLQILSLLDAVWVLSSMAPCFRHASAISSYLTNVFSAWRMLGPIARPAMACISALSALLTALSFVFLPVLRFRFASKKRKAASSSQSPSAPLYRNALSSTAYALTNPPASLTAGIGSSARPRRSQPSPKA
ncbi:hypothetical protein OIV83_001637 [Microbotryomycetes sp. JL201]|nr:hypothetical protein OIV83_001637 [Microbotryomycetes sp. JL201]